MNIQNKQYIRIIGLIGASIVFILGVLAMTIVNSFSQSWFVGSFFVVVSVVYFIIAIFLKIKRDRKLTGRYDEI
jgi:hypothetical protein